MKAGKFFTWSRSWFHVSSASPIAKNSPPSIHELYHVSPRCDGDLRRFPGRNYAHGHSRKVFQQQVELLLDSYLAAAPAPSLLSAIDITEADWQQGLIAVKGLQVPLPRARLVARELL